jgi:hypothetical protein
MKLLSREKLGRMRLVILIDAGAALNICTSAIVWLPPLTTLGLTCIETSEYPV